MDPKEELSVSEKSFLFLLKLFRIKKEFGKTGKILSFRLSAIIMEMAKRCKCRL